MKNAAIIMLGASIVAWLIYIIQGWWENRNNSDL